MRRRLAGQTFFERKFLNCKCPNDSRTFREFGSKRLLFQSRRTIETQLKTCFSNETNY